MKGETMQRRLLQSIIVALLLSLLSSFAWAVSIGDIISNTAHGSYKVLNLDHNTSSNEVNLTVSGTDATVTFMRPVSSGGTSYLLGAGSYLDNTNSWVPLPPPTLPGGGTLSTTTPETMTGTPSYLENDLAIIKVVDPDQNHDSSVRESIEVNLTSPTGDIEQIRLIETGPNTGIFTGYIPLASTAGTPHDGTLYVQAGDTIGVSYDDQAATVKTAGAVIVTPNQNLKVWIEKRVNKESAGIGEVLFYTLIVHNDETIPIGGMRVDDRLPLGLKYADGTARIGAAATTPTLSPDGKHLYFTLPTLPANGTVEITFIAKIGAGVVNGAVTNTAVVTDNISFVSNRAAVTTRIVEELMRSKGTIIGQVYECAYDKQRSGHGIAGVRLYMENGTYVVTDKNGLYHFEGVAVGSHVVQVDEDMLPEGYVMGDNIENARFAGRDFSQFADMWHGALKRVDFCLKRGESKQSRSQEPAPYRYTTPVIKKMPHYSEADLRRWQGRREILWPPKGYVPGIPSIKIAVIHDKSEKAELWLNDQPVSMLNYDGKVTDRNSTTVIDIYKGVDLLNGSNTLQVKLKTKSGSVLRTLTRKIRVATRPVKVEYVEKRSFAVADGKHSPVIAVRFLDEEGQPLRAGMTGTFRIDPPYRSQSVIDARVNDPLSQSAATDRYTVGAEGIAYIRLQPTTEAGSASLHFNLEDRDEVVHAWLKPQMREWIMVGFAEGTVGYNTLKGHQENIKEAGGEKVVKEGRVSFFAKGKVKGEWLLTLAYDSGKDTKKSKLFSEIDPNSYYTLYHDGSVQNYEASSRKKLYVKVEKERFSALYGDFSTDMTVTELSQYSRRLNGIKAEYHGDTIEGKAFISHTDQLFVKDEIRGDGTSGFYYLKHKPLLPNSEEIRIEVRDRYHPEKILSSKVLQRFKDYEIDYDRGRLSFREPIYSSDTNFNPRYIVVNYEIEGDGSEHYTMGGRVAGKAFGGAAEVGLSYISEDNAKRQSELNGVDTTLKVGSGTTVKAEYARTKTTEEGNTTYGSAKYAEIEHLSNGLHLRSYYREQQDRFGLGQLSESLGATRQLGIDVTKTFDNRIKLQGSAFRNSDLLNRKDEDVFESRIEMQQTLWSASMGYRYAKNSDTAEVHQLLLGGGYAFFDQRLKLTVAHDQSFGKDEDKVYPSKTSVGADVALTSRIDLFARYEWLHGAEKRELGRLGLRYRPWSGMTMENTTTSEFSKDATRIYNTLGMLQNYQFNEHWGFSLGYEKGQALDNNASGTNADFSAYRLGVSYRTDGWSATLNGEYRDADTDQKYNLTGAIYTQPDSDTALALSAAYSKEEEANSVGTDANLRLSVAYRPEQTDVIVLDKLDLVHSKRNALQEDLLTQKMINNLVVNITPNPRMELSLQHGIKYVRDSVNNYEFKGVTQLFGVDMRYDLTEKWMVGAQLSLLYAQSANNMDYGAGIYTGYNLFTNMLLIGGYNWKGFEDRDFSLQNYRIEGPYLQFKMKFDQKNLKAAVRWLSW